MSFPFGVGVGDFLAVSTLAMKVYTAYKDTPNELRNISDEINSLRIMIENGKKGSETRFSPIQRGCS